VTGDPSNDLTDGEPFSLLLPTYHADDADHLRRAFASAVDDQVRKPTEVVLVRDGVVPPRLQRVIDELAETSPVPVHVVALEQNIGLGHALDAGLAACSHEVVARMDADDVSLPDRFAVQIPLVASGNDLVGSALLEFHEHEDDIVGLRTPPLTDAEIRSWARFHDPFNHPTVVYRRSMVQQVGGYQDLPLLEDYWLFARMIDAGARVANVAEPLVKYRVGSGAYARRGGWQLLRSEIELQRQFRASGFTSRPQFLRNLVVRGGYRLVPEGIRRVAYRRVIAPKGERDQRQPGG
jgi:glycosyltransferase involved in cell wall biosynthesis